MSLKLINIIIIISFAINLSAQMTEGDYPYQVLDSLFFNKSNLQLQIDTLSKPTNFVSTQEQFYELFLSIYMEKADSYRKTKNELHQKLCNRDFLAGISNYSNDTMHIPSQDKSIIAILEFKNDKDIWRPIQFWPISGCGNSDFYETIAPGQTLLIPIKKNYGSIRAEMRLRFHGDDTIFISDTFIGKIDNEMFKVANDLKISYSYIMCDSITFLKTPFKEKYRPFGNIEIIEIDE